ncbi:concanavalin A-like lectin/glucanase domain-containing protein [Glomus cerebriforme]|uniref:Concanavalin A-like lectin/glucanase domain-containing protein n=1 Tax=Glomus cerebriforme TaxID=658196 RepID=A0A397SA90_9GLOM|nr:concanavalin A-like lectin/glucanase domain-containing protein [Glomus cerebriforme]
MLGYVWNDANEILPSKVLKECHDEVFICTKAGVIRGLNEEFVGIRDDRKDNCKIKSPIKKTVAAMTKLVKEGNPLLLLKNKTINDLELPTCWEITNSSRNIKIVDNNLGLLYNGPGGLDDSAASLTDNSIPVDVGIYYYEAKIIDEGKKTNIGIGFCKQNMLLNRLPGWDWNSYGYHGDDGKRFQRGNGIRYGPFFNRGDIVGCGINFLNQTAFYTKNGVHLGTAFNNIIGEFHPMIGMRSLNERILINFGNNPFLFDINNYSKEIFKEYLKLYEEKKKEFSGNGKEIDNNLLPVIRIAGEGSDYDTNSDFSDDFWI